MPLSPLGFDDFEDWELRDTFFGRAEVEGRASGFDLLRI